VLVDAGAVSAFATLTTLNKPPTATKAAAAPKATDFFSIPQTIRHDAAN
jgi:hypothetical protein